MSYLYGVGYLNNRFEDYSFKKKAVHIINACVIYSIIS